MKKLFLICSTICVSVFISNAKVKMGDIFGNNMVLQQQSEVALWGKAKANSTLKIKTSWNKKTYSTTVNNAGLWRLNVATTSAGGPYEIILNDGEKLTLSNVMLGEVWICAGQSNMEMPMKGYRNQPIAGANMDIVKSKNSNMRLFTVPRDSKSVVQDSFAKKVEWQSASPEAVANFSATGYYFGKMLNEMLNVPVGLICVAYGGSQAESWMRADMLADFPEIILPKNDKDIKTPNRTPTCLFNTMLNPVIGYGIKGCIWYQGESNYERPDQYERLFPAMVASWRKLWNIGDFPFIFAQIAPYNNAQLPPFNKGGKYNSAFLRDAQRKSESVIPNSSMVVLLDLGEENCIHPTRKKEGGERFALQALSRVYGIKGFAYAAPTYKNLKISNDTVTVYFEDKGLGLTATGAPNELFEVAGADKKFYSAKAKINSGKYPTITLTCPNVKNPVAVRYAFKDFVVGTLLSTEGLPVSSFRTDDWDE